MAEETLGQVEKGSLTVRHACQRSTPRRNAQPYRVLMTDEWDSGTEDSSGWSAGDLAAPLAPLRFLEGTWEGEGQGPYGPYQLEAVAAIRGRWLLLTYEIRGPGSDDIFYFSTQVYGYDDDGLFLELYDTAGSFTFRGTVRDDGSLRFDWADDDETRRSEFEPHRDGGLDFTYEHIDAEPGNPPNVFEGPWRRV